MSKNVALPESFAISLPGETDETLTVSVSDIPDHILVNLIEFGIKEKFNNACAGFGKEGKSLADYRKACETILAAFAAGTWAKRGGGRVATFEAFLRREADKEAERLTKKGAKYEGKDKDKVSEALQKHEAYVEKKRELWDARRASPEVELEIE